MRRGGMGVVFSLLLSVCLGGGLGSGLELADPPLSIASLVCNAGVCRVPGHFKEGANATSEKGFACSNLNPLSVSQPIEAVGRGDGSVVVAVSSRKLDQWAICLVPPDFTPNAANGTNSGVRCTPFKTGSRIWQLEANGEYAYALFAPEWGKYDLCQVSLKDYDLSGGITDCHPTASRGSFAIMQLLGNHLFFTNAGVKSFCKILLPLTPTSTHICADRLGIDEVHPDFYEYNGQVFWKEASTHRASLLCRAPINFTTPQLSPTCTGTLPYPFSISGGITHDDAHNQVIGVVVNGGERRPTQVTTVGACRVRRDFKDKDRWNCTFKITEQKGARGSSTAVIVGGQARWLFSGDHLFAIQCPLEFKDGDPADCTVSKPLELPTGMSAGGVSETMVVVGGNTTLLSYGEGVCLLDMQGAKGAELTCSSGFSVGCASLTPL